MCIENGDDEPLLAESGSKYSTVADLSSLFKSIVLDGDYQNLYKKLQNRNEYNWSSYEIDLTQVIHHAVNDLINDLKKNCAIDYLRPTKQQKIFLAKSIVQTLPVLDLYRDIDEVTEGHDLFHLLGTTHQGYIEVRLRALRRQRDRKQSQSTSKEGVEDCESPCKNKRNRRAKTDDSISSKRPKFEPLRPSLSETELEVSRLSPTPSNWIPMLLAFRKLFLDEKPSLRKHPEVLKYFKILSYEGKLVK